MGQEHCSRYAGREKGANLRNLGRWEHPSLLWDPPLA